MKMLACYRPTWPPWAKSVMSAGNDSSLGNVFIDIQVNCNFFLEMDLTQPLTTKPRVCTPMRASLVRPCGVERSAAGLTMLEFLMNVTTKSDVSYEKGRDKKISRIRNGFLWRSERHAKRLISPKKRNSTLIAPHEKWQKIFKVIASSWVIF